MASDFTVIQAVRQRFGGGQTAGEAQVENNAPFVGVSKEFPFSCPNVDPSEWAVLQFESLGVTSGLGGGNRNIIRVNGVDVPGSLTPGPTHEREDPDTRLPVWKSHSLLVPTGVMKDENELYIEAVPTALDWETLTDSFTIDNVVIFYKT